MSSIVWLTQDLARILASSQQAMIVTSNAVGTDNRHEYRQGYMDALHTVAIAIGVQLPRPPTDNPRLRDRA